LACLAMVADFYGHHADLADLRRRFSISLKGASLPHLMRYAATLALSARPVRLELAELAQLKTPCILHWNLNHFVVLKQVRTNWRGQVRVIVLDPVHGERALTLEQVSASFTGVALELAPTSAFALAPRGEPVAVRDLTGPVLGLRRALLQIGVLALTLELFVLVAPLFNQFVIDEVIVGADRELLSTLLIGFGLLLLTQTAISLARSWFLMRWSIDVGLQWSGRVFAHLIRLPVAYFEKRHLGDVISRFGSVAQIQATLTSLFVESALDGLMALLALGMMYLYSPRLSVIVLSCVLLYMGLRALFYHPLREASRERLVLASRENSHFVETIRAITALKLFGREAERQARWLNLKQDVINRDVKTQKLGILFKLSNTTINGVQTLAVFYVGAGLVMDNAMSIGMLMAFTTYATTFSTRTFSLVDAFVNLRMLGMHGERLADIVLAEVEAETVPETDLDRIDPSITLKNVKFRYGEGEPWVLDGIDLHIPAGQSVALVGPSGCGKTTLCKVLLGLLTPTEGEILIGAFPIAQLGLRSYRQLVGTVMQDDVLLAGSIFDNISFFDGGADVASVEHCAQMAAIHADIMAMPMGYQTLVGDMGSALSGGQKQRVLLARALFKAPRILALDEATSHLDIENEHLVNRALGQLQLTRIMVAHRPETINAAERVVGLAAGRIVALREPVIRAAPLANRG
jgi:ATP-binding cassette subfamily B protein RaxB